PSRLLAGMACAAVLLVLLALVVPATATHRHPVALTHTSGTRPARGGAGSPAHAAPSDVAGGRPGSAESPPTSITAAPRSTLPTTSSSLGASSVPAAGGELSPRSSALFAVVAHTGALLRSSNGTRLERRGPGEWLMHFANDVTGCATVAT